MKKRYPVGYPNGMVYAIICVNIPCDHKHSSLIYIIIIIYMMRKIIMGSSLQSIF